MSRPSICSFILSSDLLHDDNSTESLEGLDNLLALLLWYTLLHELRCALDKLLAVHQRKTQHALDLLDDLWLGGRLERLQLEVEQSLFLRGRCGLLLLDGCCCLGGGRCCEATDGQIWDVEAGLVELVWSLFATLIPS
jgi:hypothetical protein